MFNNPMLYDRHIPQSRPDTIRPELATEWAWNEAGKFDMTFPYKMPMPIVKDIQARGPAAGCESSPNNLSVDLSIARSVAAFDKLEILEAMALAFDRKSLIDIVSEGKSDQGGSKTGSTDCAAAWRSRSHSDRTHLHFGAEFDRIRRRRSRYPVLRELRVRGEPQFLGLLQQRDRCTGGRAVAGNRFRETPRHGLGYRQTLAGRFRAADYLCASVGDVPTTMGEERYGEW
ncbi:MAG: hypothetical protein WCI94_02095 [Rhodospirillales bacterium]